ncbi:ribosomal subunit interface protein [Rhodothalassium salexigens]|uniref:Ribosome hibernation promoting factor n=1 Tax=Rhodothalassium salexigens DSM 2132 TaxID=1188247 RepID=A0A4R2PIV7_RHOSA|nr:ribosome-associated translation inhibitor RaiA [Rhodothalassium salexigens]MBB4211326.1 ribosomal subunit interface protein [Rhodothalassium salexigens DSM 2132]MBK1639508.1 ribosomal subunit interface protein [Rhodothalassium salexigens DSM 2132]MBK5912233.1 ribosomal subunit interface protein [Rhodothalassium salexigens]MBK5919444.1 ribosomal subunit interface protein [Rhodothalassium salexigens]TCP35247.1 SSU ribosomal protein S30P /sigma 54 modulation protein [Rhodothalassium salexigens
MQISVTGRHLDIGDAFRSHITDRLNAIVEKYFDRAIEAQVTMSKQAHLYRADCTLHASQGTVLQARAEGGDVYGTFDGVADKIEKQLRRYKRRLKDHSALSRREGVETLIAQAYVLAPEGDEADNDDSDAVDANGGPAVIAETRTEVPTVSVESAVMMMDLRDLPVLVFRNPGSGAVNVVYRRQDGNIGWIDPAPADSRSKAAE